MAELVSKNFRYIIDTLLITFIGALIIALVNGYILVQQESVRIADIQQNIRLIQKQQTRTISYLINGRH